MVLQDNPNLKYSQIILHDKYKMFKNKTPNSTTIESHNSVDLITYNYEVGNKKFIAVVQYDKKTPENTKIVEVSPVEITIPLKFDQTVLDNKKITTCNNPDELQA